MSIGEIFVTRVEKILKILFTHNLTKLIFYTATFIIFVSFFFSKGYCTKAIPANSMFSKSPVIDKEKISFGYTLLSPYSRIGGEPVDGGKVYLIDLFGKPAHIWNTQYPVFYSKLKKNGNLVAALIAPDLPYPETKSPYSGRTGIIQELDWDGNVVWEYKNDMLHHDFEVLPDGNIAVLLYERVPKGIAINIKGGREGTELDNDIWSDAIVEIDSQGKEVWAWRVYDYLNTSEDKLGPISTRVSWTHANSIRFLEKDPFDHEEAYLINFRNINIVAIVKKRNGKILWRSPKDILGQQHDASLLANGNILVFDNNLYNEGSRIVEIDPQQNKIVWEFTGGKSYNERARFKVEYAGGVQRLSNGNTLVVNSPLGYIFEIDKDGKIVWDFINPFSAYRTGPWPNNFLFNAKRYAEEEITWPEKLSPPLPFPSLVCSKIRDFF